MLISAFEILSNFLKNFLKLIEINHCADWVSSFGETEKQQVRKLSGTIYNLHTAQSYCFPDMTKIDFVR